MSGQDRMHIGGSHERRVAARLMEHGWTVQPWGQGLLNDDARIVLQTIKPNVLWRWLPDLIATKDRNAVLVEAKSCKRTDTPNFSIEIDCLMAQRAMSALGLTIVIVWGDMTVNTPHNLDVVRWDPYPGRNSFGGGSGTPMALVRKDAQRPFEWAFGPPIARQEAG